MEFPMCVSQSPDPSIFLHCRLVWHCIYINTGHFIKNISRSFVNFIQQNIEDQLLFLLAMQVALHWTLLLTFPLSCLSFSQPEDIWLRIGKFIRR